MLTLERLGEVASTALSGGANRVASVGTSMAGASLGTGMVIGLVSGTVRLHLSANVIGSGWASGWPNAAVAVGGSSRNGSIGGGTIGDVGNDDAASNAEFWRTHSPRLGVGNGLDSANGSATTKTKTPPTTPAVITAQLEIRSAEGAGRSTLISNRVQSSDDDDCPSPGAKSHHGGQNATNVAISVIIA